MSFLLHVVNGSSMDLHPYLRVHNGAGLVPFWFWQLLSWNNLIYQNVKTDIYITNVTGFIRQNVFLFRLKIKISIFEQKLTGITLKEILGSVEQNRTKGGTPVWITRIWLNDKLNGYSLKKFKSLLTVKTGLSHTQSELYGSVFGLKTESVWQCYSTVLPEQWAGRVCGQDHLQHYLDWRWCPADTWKEASGHIHTDRSAGICLGLSPSAHPLSGSSEQLETTQQCRVSSTLLRQVSSEAHWRRNSYRIREPLEKELSNRTWENSSLTKSCKKRNMCCFSGINRLGVLTARWIMWTEGFVYVVSSKDCVRSH